MPMFVVVIDVNGVLGDVRKMRAALSGRTPDAFLCSSNQVFYWRPGAVEFLKRLKSIPNICLVLWTSRLRKNAAPIEAQLQASQYFHAMLHGEDCEERRDGFHPLKDVRILRRYFEEIRNAVIAFVDDKPQYVSLDPASFAVRCATYDAADSDCSDADQVAELDRVAREIEHVARRVSA